MIIRDGTATDPLTAMSWLKAHITKARMIIRPASVRPADFALCLADVKVIDRGVAGSRQALGVELPILVAATAKPLAVSIVPFIGKAHGDARTMNGPDLFD